jgi:DNA-binding HxlR family transcriptional regulator
MLAPMVPDNDRGATRQEFEVAYYTKELGRSLQRKMLQSRLDDLAEYGIAGATHGDEPSADTYAAPPREDRAG